MADSGGGGGESELSSACSGGGRDAAAAYRTFRSLVENADRKFARIRDLQAHERETDPHCRRKVFKAYTKAWRFQQERRKELVEGGMRRWEIGDVASRIGQLYYGQYLRTSDVRFLGEAYVFYEAILSRGYFERGKQGIEVRRGKQGLLSDLGVRCKELRFYARFVLVAILLDRRDLASTLVGKWTALLEHCRVAFPDTNFKEWRSLLNDVSRFLKADGGFVGHRGLRYSPLFDFHPSSTAHLGRIQSNRNLRLQEAILTSYHRNEVKFSELTLDTYRMAQCLEWEPDGSNHRTAVGESADRSTVIDHSGASGFINMKFSSDLADPNLPSNPRKSLLHRPSASHLIAVIAAICEELLPDSVMLLYISASGGSAASRNYPTANKPMSGLTLGSHGNTRFNCLYPSDLIPFTRNPLFLVIDSDNSRAFKILQDSVMGEPPVMLISPRKSTPERNPTSSGSQFTLFLTSPLQAFCQLVGLPDVDQERFGIAESSLSAAMGKWEVILCSSARLNPAFVRVLSDPFLRRLITRLATIPAKSKFEFLLLEQRAQKLKSVRFIRASYLILPIGALSKSPDSRIFLELLCAEKSSSILIRHFLPSFPADWSNLEVIG